MRPTHFGRAMAAASTAALLATVLAACGGAGESAPAAGTPLSADQQVFEAEHLHGGSFTLAYNLPYGGGTLADSTHYFYAASSGVLNASPLTAGRETETPSYASLNAALSVPPSSSATRYLVTGQIDVRSRGASHVVSYTGGAIRIDDLADDGTTVVQSSLLFDLSEFPLSGTMLNAPAAAATSGCAGWAAATRRSCSMASASRRASRSTR